MMRIEWERRWTMERVRISDIAEELGLSTATVSNVIHGKTGKVSPETVRRVQEALEKRRYIPSMAGILLAQNDSRIIGVVINDHEKYQGHLLEDPFIAASLNALAAEIDRRGLFMMVKATTKPQDIIRFASMWNLEGMVLIGFCQEDYQLLRDQMHIPFVVYDGYLEDPRGICNLTLDNFDGGFQVGRYFRNLGYQKALCIADNDICMDRERREGFSAGFGAADFWQIPMAGFDDTPLCGQMAPALTSVRQDNALRARLALEKLAAMKAGEESGSTLRLPVTLIKRDSTCSP